MSLAIKNKSFMLMAGIMSLTLGLNACNTADQTTPDGGSTSTEGGGGGLTGEIQVDGSSTVYPISQVMAEEFNAENSDVRITVGVSGSGGGFKKFCAGETDISNASRPIKESEMELCKEAGIEYVEVPVAFDGLSVVVNPENDWATCLTAEELGKVWAPEAEGQVMSWSQVKEGFPDVRLDLYGPGTDSGTYDYFTDATVGDEGVSRGDYTASEDDNIIVQGVSSETEAMGFFGYAYYEENKDSLKIMEIENSDGTCLSPTLERIADGSYNPLSRPIFFYVKKTSLEEKPEVAAFVNYHLAPANSDKILTAGYVPLPEDINAKVQARIDNKTTGSIFEGGSSVGVKLADKL